jgi:hypothetical protein
MRNMKKLQFIIVALVGLICASGVFMGGAPDASAAEKSNSGEGRLVITRSPKLGSGTFITVSVDGKRLGSLGSGKGYQGTLTPGKHTVTVLPDQNQAGQKATPVEVDVVSGQTYSFSATIQHGDIVLVKNR